MTLSVFSTICQGKCFPWFLCSLLRSTACSGRGAGGYSEASGYDVLDQTAKMIRALEALSHEVITFNVVRSMCFFKERNRRELLNLFHVGEPLGLGPLINTANLLCVFAKSLCRARSHPVPVSLCVRGNCWWGPEGTPQPRPFWPVLHDNYFGFQLGVCGPLPRDESIARRDVFSVCDVSTSHHAALLTRVLSLQCPPVVNVGWADSGHGAGLSRAPSQATCVLCCCLFWGVWCKSGAISTSSCLAPQQAMQNKSTKASR